MKRILHLWKKLPSIWKKIFLYPSALSIPFLIEIQLSHFFLMPCCKSPRASWLGRSFLHVGRGRGNRLKLNLESFAGASQQNARKTHIAFTVL
jgi:hypothetical protein